MPFPDSHEVYLNCTPTIPCIASEDVVENDIVFLTVSASGRCTAAKASAVSNALGASHILFSVRRGGLTGQPCEVTLIHAVYTGASGNVGEALYLADAPGTLASTDDAGVSRAVAVRVPGGYVFSGSI